MATPFSRTVRALGADTPRFSWLTWTVTMLGLVAWLTWFVAGRVTVVEVSQRARVEVLASPHPLVADLPGRLLRPPPAVGRVVKAGEVLATLDAGRLEAQAREAAARLGALAPRRAALQHEIAALDRARASDRGAANAAAQAAQARVREAATAAELAHDEARRLGAERGSGAVAEVDVLRAQADSRRLQAAAEALAADARRLALDADGREQQAQARIEALRREVATLDGEAAVERAAQAVLAREIDRHQLRAPVDGTLAEVAPLAAGAFIAEGQRLATVVPGGALRIVADFHPGSALGRLAAGQRATLRLDGYPWAQFGTVDAAVVRVAGEWRDGLLRAELVPLEPGGTGATASRPALRHGLTGAVEVQVEAVAPAVLVLRAAGRAWSAPATPAADPDRPGPGLRAGEEPGR